MWAGGWVFMGWVFVGGTAVNEAHVSGQQAVDNKAGMQPAAVTALISKALAHPGPAKRPAATSCGWWRLRRPRQTACRSAAARWPPAAAAAGGQSLGIRRRQFGEPASPHVLAAPGGALLKQADPRQDGVVRSRAAAPTWTSVAVDEASSWVRMGMASDSACAVGGKSRQAAGLEAKGRKPLEYPHGHSAVH